MLTIKQKQQNGNPLAHLSARDIIVLLYIVGGGISPLRADWGITDDLAALRHELRARETGRAAA